MPKDKPTEFKDWPQVPVGILKTFGENGSKYMVGHLTREMDDGDWMIEVLEIGTGERFDYRLSKMLQDPSVA